MNYEYRYSMILLIPLLRSSAALHVLSMTYTRYVYIFTSEKLLCKWCYSTLIRKYNVHVSVSILHIRKCKLQESVSTHAYVHTM